MADEQESASAERVEPESRVASDEKAVAEPEIEPGKSSDEEPRIESAESAATPGESAEAGCPVGMGYYPAQSCGRKLHAAPDGVDERLVCLMHSKDPNKQSGPLFDAFWLEFERILAEAGENEAFFERFIFPQVDIRGREFQAACRFDGATFTQDANFDFATFKQYANFDGATFKQKADFYAATFTQNASFFGAAFTQRANFQRAAFTQGANFILATFKQKADFYAATFTQDANFDFATFTQVAGFWSTRFHGRADWRRCNFLDQAEFRHTQFLPTIDRTPSGVFYLAKFARPAEAVFDDVDLSHALFHNSDASQVWFTSSVKWAKRESNRGLAVFEETVPLDQDFERELQRDGQRDYRAVAQIYQQLKKNYDSRLDYWTANEFHFGEMEMKRLAGPTGGPLLRLRRWLHPRLSLVALYRYASDYGNSYGKPMLWLLGILVLFAALFPLPGVGLKRQGASQAESYASVWNLQKSYGENLWREGRLAGKGAIAAVDTATFQKSAEYAPAYPWGRVLAIFETLLTSTLFGLFLLAIRRQFRR
jgi:hypothetical protein